MPIYDYQCRNCGHRVEVVHGVNTAGPTACDQCGGPMRKLLTTPTFVFKGSGWAKKDRSAPPAAKSDEKTPATAGDSGSKSEASPAPAGTANKASEKSASPTTTSSGGTGSTD